MGLMQFKTNFKDGAWDLATSARQESLELVISYSADYDKQGIFRKY